MSLIDIKISEKFPDFDVMNFLIIENNTQRGVIRGFHAHKKANQLIIPIRGRIMCNLISHENYCSLLDSEE